MTSKSKLRIPVLTAAMVLTLTAGARLSSDKSDINRSLDIFSSVFKEVQLNYVDTLDANKAVDNAILYMLNEIDPYTVYYSSSDTDELWQMSTGEYGGVGSVINKSRNGQVRFSELMAGSPALAAGAKGGDIIMAIDTTEIKPDFTVSRVSELLRGTPGSRLSVRVRRPYPAPGTDSILTLDIERAKIHTPAVVYYGTAGPDGKTGYISLSSFTDKAADEVRNALTDLMSAHGITSLVLDLQGNPGGLLESAVQIAGLFVPKGTEIVRTKGRDPLSERIYKTTRQPVAPDMPLAVLIDGGSASAAEIVAGAMQDLDRAVIIGGRSYGKGLVQSSRPVPYDGMVKITVAKYYIPSGRLIQAIDYSHRNPYGSVARTPDSLTSVFRTIHGREVRDGGGITPDITVEPLQSNRLLANITAGGWDVDYATRYVASRPDLTGGIRDFVITDSIFEDFKSTVDPDEFKYDRVCETALTSLRQTVKREGYMNDSVDARITALEQLLRHDLSHDLDLNRKALDIILTNAIIPRYAFQAGAVEAGMKFNEPLNRALKILGKPEEYSKLLGR